MKRLLVLLLYIYPFFVFSNNDSTVIFRVSDIEFIKDIPDENIDGFKLYSYKDFKLGNPGLFNESKFSTEYSLFNSSHTNSINDILFRIGKPVTSLVFSNSSKKQQYFEIDHSQGVGRNVFLKVNFSRVNAEGFYFNQIADYTNFSFSPFFISNNNRLKLFSSFNFNNREYGLNGGVTKDAVIILDTSNVSEINLPVERISSNARLNDRNISLVGFYNILSDSINDMSIGVSYSKANKYYKFNDIADSSFYSNYYVQISGSFFDSLNYSTENIGLTLFSSWDSISDFGWKLGGKYFKENYYQESIDTTLYHTLLNARFKRTIGTSLVELYSDYEIEGANKGDINLTSKFDLDSTFTFAYSFNRNFADVFYRLYESNYYKWNNRFDKMKYHRINASFLSKNEKLNVLLSADLINDYVYLDSNSIANQFNSDLILMNARVSYKFNYREKWNFDNDIELKYTSDSVVRDVPTFTLISRLYYKNKLFKKTTGFTGGVELLYHSKYYSDAFNPALSVFYRQTNQLIGNYPFIDVFVQMDIADRAKVMFRVNHINSGLTGLNYMLTPDYLTAPRHFQVVVKWNLFN